MFWWYFFVFKQKTAYEMRISDWSSDVCSSDLLRAIISVAAGNADGPHRPVRWHFGSDRMQSYVGEGCACVPSCPGAASIHAVHRARDGHGTPASERHRPSHADRKSVV